MKGNLEGWDANGIEPASDFTPIPEGNYRACFVASEVKETKKAQESGRREDGEYLEFTVQVLEEPYAGRTVPARLNLWNPSEQAVEIAKRELSSICRAVGKMSPQDSSELHNVPFIVKLGIKTYDGKLYNEVKGYNSLKPDEAAPSTNRVPATQHSPATAEAGKNGGGKKAPWLK